MKFAPFLVPALLLLPFVPVPADTLTDLFPPDTRLVVGIRVHNLVLSSVAQNLAPQVRAAAADWLKAVSFDGVDLLRDIDEVVIASSAKGPNSPSIIVVTGRFNLPRLSDSAKPYHNVPVIAGETEASTVVALLDAGTVVIGDPALVRAAIDQRGRKARIDSALNDRITSLRQRYDFWGLGDRPEGFTAPIPEAALMQCMDRFQFGMQVANGVELTAEIHPRNSKESEKLGDAIQKIAALLKGPETSPSGTRFDLQSDGGTWRLTLSMPEVELKKAIEAQTGVVLPAMAPATAAIPEAPVTGPNAAPEAVPVVAAAAPAPVPPPATPVNPQGTHKPAGPEAHDTVVFTLPGKK